MVFSSGISPPRFAGVSGEGLASAGISLPYFSFGFALKKGIFLIFLIYFSLSLSLFPRFWL